MAIVGFVFAVAIAMFVVELIMPARPLKAISGWWARAILLNAVQISSVFLGGVAWDRWFQEWGPWRADETLGIEGGAIAGYLVITFIYYWWHRARHEVPFLWRVFHQLHHSPKRIEVVTSFYKHPVEILANSMLSSIILYVLCGLSPESAALAVVMTVLAELFYHCNIKTPYWAGFIIQRPESHLGHHKQVWHSQNFSDLPMWDILFGTFHNPRQFVRECGFERNLEARFSDVVRCFDVHIDRVGESEPGI